MQLQTKTYRKANKCLFSRGHPTLEHATISSSYLSLPALAPNDCSPPLGHITFVLYQFLWTAERYWASLITESIWISNQTWTPHPYFQRGRFHIFSHCFVCLYMSNGGETVGNKKKIIPSKKIWKIFKRSIWVVYILFIILKEYWQNV